MVPHQVLAPTLLLQLAMLSKTKQALVSLHQLDHLFIEVIPFFPDGATLKKKNFALFHRF